MTIRELFASPSLIGPLVAVLLAIIGWAVVHQLNMKRDRINKRREMITEILLSAYRHLEIAANREDKTEEQAVAFESAIADIQLLGSPSQVLAVRRYANEHARNEGGNIDSLLQLLRDELRMELDLVPLKDSPVIFRFVRDWGYGDSSGNPVPRTPIVNTRTKSK